MSFELYRLEELEQLYQEAVQNRDIEMLILYGGAYFDRLRGGTMYPEDREKLQHVILSIKAQNPTRPNP